MSIEKWSESIIEQTYRLWSSKYADWKPGFKIFYSPVYPNPRLIILSHNPGGNETSFLQEDKLQYQNGNFVVQDYHSYADRSRTLARHIQKFFDGHENLLKHSIPIPVLFFRSKDVRQWKNDFTKIYSEQERKDVESFCYDKTRERY